MVKKILLCPLDWGLGHASRCIPLIKRLIENMHEVIIAADKGPLKLLKEEFPYLQFIKFTGVKIRYSGGKSQMLSMFFLVPSIIFWIVKEHFLLKKIIRDYQIEIVISDNRFGLWHKQIKTIYITHQVMIKMPVCLKFIEYPFYRLHKWIIEKYNYCFIPDFPDGQTLSADLSHKFPLPGNAIFIGLLSKFSETVIPEIQHYGYIDFDALVILSGPEPQRTILEQKLISDITSLNIKSLIIQGVMNEIKIERRESESLTIINFMTSSDLAWAISKARYVICRAGYSSIMDLVALQKKAILIPTPGQTEQEYLAEYYHHNNYFYSISQDKIDLKPAFQSIENLALFPIQKPNNLLDKALLLI